MTISPTPLNQHLHQGIRRTARAVYPRVGQPTAALRLLPSFIVVGAQRCGTTSLFRALMTHPRVMRPAFHKGVNYFDLNYFRGMSWYRGHFPLAAPAKARTRAHGGPLAFESSGYYLYHPLALTRLAHHLPATKIVVMLRDPVERAYSAFEHERARGFEAEDFETALALEDQRLAGEVERMRRDSTYESFTHRHQSYVRRGHYADQLRNAYSLFPAEQILVIQSEEYFADPDGQFRRLTDFLEIEPIIVHEVGKHNARPRAPMQEETRRRLLFHFQPYDEALGEMLGDVPAWRRLPAA